MDDQHDKVDERIQQGGPLVLSFQDMLVNDYCNDETVVEESIDETYNYIFPF